MLFCILCWRFESKSIDVLIFHCRPLVRTFILPHSILRLIWAAITRLIVYSIELWYLTLILYASWSSLDVIMSQFSPQHFHRRYGTLVRICVEICARGIKIASIVDISSFVHHRFGVDLSVHIVNWGHFNVFLDIYDYWIVVLFFN